MLFVNSFPARDGIPTHFVVLMFVCVSEALVLEELGMPPAEAFGLLLFVDIALILCQSLAFSCYHTKNISFFPSLLSLSTEVKRGDKRTHRIAKGVCSERRVGGCEMSDDCLALGWGGEKRWTRGSRKGRDKENLCVRNVQRPFTCHLVEPQTDLLSPSC